MAVTDQSGNSAVGRGQSCIVFWQEQKDMGNNQANHAKIILDAYILHNAKGMLPSTS